MFVLFNFRKLSPGNLPTPKISKLLVYVGILLRTSFGDDISRLEVEFVIAPEKLELRITGIDSDARQSMLPRVCLENAKTQGGIRPPTHILPWEYIVNHRFLNLIGY
jgi:hypothetical protein